jgi:hypothetical protein
MKTVKQLSLELYPDVSFKEDVASEDTFRTNEIRRIQRVAFENGYNAAKRWIKADKELPDLLPDCGFSKNVLARVEGYTDIQVMCIEFIRSENGKWVYVWANCYGDINGEGDYDDDYNVIEWKYID